MNSLQDANRRMMISGTTLLVQAGLSATAAVMGTAAPVQLGLAKVLFDALGGLAGNALVTDAYAAGDRPVPDAEARRWNHDILRASALAISDIIKGAATEFPPATQASMTELAKVVATYYDEMDDTKPLAVVTEAEVKAALAQGESVLQEEAGAPALWTAFLHHLINTHEDLPAIKQPVLEALGGKIARGFHRQLLEVLKFDFDASGSPTRGRAYASVTLRLLMNAAQSDDRLLTLVARLQLANDSGHRTTHEKLGEIEDRLKALTRQDPILAYCAELQRVFEVHENLGLPPPGNPEEKDEPLSIRKLFVEPTYTHDHYSPEAFDDAVEQKKSPAWALLPLLAAQQRVVLLADPGMGKSTLVQWLLSSLAAQALDPAVRTPFPGAIPLPFILRDLVRLLPDDHTRWDWPGLLEAFKRYKPGLTAAEALAAPLLHDKLSFATLLRSQNVFFLIDGLDEIGDLRRRQALRQALWTGFAVHPQARFLITSRIVGYEESVIHKGSDNRGSTRMLATRLYLAPFDDAQQDLFARNWYLPRLGPAAGTERAALFMEAVRRHTSTRVIGRVPNLLYLLALLYRHKAHLPDGRAQVYAAISDAYLEGITLARQLQHQPGLSVPYTLQEKETFLATIAMHMQVRRAQLAQDDMEEHSDEVESDEVESDEVESDEMHDGEVLATSQDLRDWLAPSFGGAQTPEHCAAVDAFIDYVARRAGLLLPRGEGAFAFAHLSFQEYYAARHLKAEFSRLTHRPEDTEGVPAKAIQADWQTFIEWSRESPWREVFIFLVESHKEDPHATWALVRKVFFAETALEEAEKSDLDGQPHRCLPLAAAELLASLSLNRDVSLTDSHRQKIWSSLWQAYLRWPVDIKSTHPWSISLALLHDTPFLSQVIQALVQVFKACKATQLSLEDCFHIGDFSFVQHLDSLTTLDLCRCTGMTSLELLSQLPLQSLCLMELSGLTSLEPLRALPLKSLHLYGCTGLTSLEPLCAMPLQWLRLGVCTGLTSLEPLRTVPLQSLDLYGCKSLTSLEPLHALPLQSLNISLCSGIPREQVDAFRIARPDCRVVT